MQLYNLKDPAETATFRQAVQRGLGRRQGLFYNPDIPRLDDIDGVLAMGFIPRSVHILAALIGPEIERAELARMVAEAFDFPAPVRPVEDRVSTLELFHGPTLAFKDFGARFMAQCLSLFARDSAQTVTILTATSGDTGAAVAHAFYGQPGVRAVILYPKDKVTPLQEKLFSTLGGNIHVLAVESDFDRCQALVKRAFDDETLRRPLQLTSANSINISRLIAQVCYYFEGVARLPAGAKTVVSVPSGNFGNLTAGLMARAMGAPIHRFIAAVNANDTVARFIADGAWAPRPTVQTLANAMDVSRPNNFPRILALAERQAWDVRRELHAASVDDPAVLEAIRELHQRGVVSEPHGAIAYRCLVDDLKPDETGLFLGTAHPAKFRETVEAALGAAIDLPAPLCGLTAKPSGAVTMAPDFEKLKDFLLRL